VRQVGQRRRLYRPADVEALRRRLHPPGARGRARLLSRPSPPGCKTENVRKCLAWVARKASDEIQRRDGGGGLRATGRQAATPAKRRTAQRTLPRNA